MSTEQTNQCLELLKESFENYRTKCNEWQLDIKRLMKHFKLFTKK